MESFDTGGVAVGDIIEVKVVGITKFNLIVEFHLPGISSPVQDVVNIISIQEDQSQDELISFFDNYQLGQLLPAVIMLVDSYPKVRVGMRPSYFHCREEWENFKSLDLVGAVRQVRVIHPSVNVLGSVVGAGYITDLDTTVEIRNIPVHWRADADFIIEATAGRVVRWCEMLSYNDLTQRLVVNLVGQ